MQTFTTKSGASVTVAPAPYVDAKRMKKAIQRELGAGSHMLQGIKFDTAKPFDMDAAPLLGLLMQVDGSEGFDAALWPCLARCTRNGDKVIESTFDDPEARKDYYEIVIACVKENIGPLAAGLLSVLPADMLTQKKQTENVPQ